MIPITVFTGAGKTTVICSLIQQFPSNYKIVLLKNEFGDVQGNFFYFNPRVDSQIVKQKANITVTEILNNCLCCVLIGQLKNALLEIQEQIQPDRIIIETSGSAFPAPIAWQIRELDGFHLDAILTVVDCVNFKGYEDTSYTAKIQAQYTDLILLNKWELVSERELDIVIDHINELNTDTPKVKCNVGEGISPDLVIGIDTQLFSEASHETQFASDHHSREVDLFNITTIRPFHRLEFEAFLKQVSRENVYRIKGFVQFLDSEQIWILNWAFERYTLTEYESSNVKGTQLTVMGIDLVFQQPIFLQKLSLEPYELVFSPAK